MTKGEVLKQVYDLSVGGNFNHETGWSFSKFKSYVAEKFNSEKRQSIIMEIELPDGWWYLSILKIKDGLWDYYIPDTREENDSIYNEIVKELEGRKENMYNI